MPAPRPGTAQLPPIYSISVHLVHLACSCFSGLRSPASARSLLLCRSRSTVELTNPLQLSRVCASRVRAAVLVLRLAELASVALSLFSKSFRSLYFYFYYIIIKAVFGALTSPSSSSIKLRTSIASIPLLPSSILYILCVTYVFYFTNKNPGVARRAHGHIYMAMAPCGRRRGVHQGGPGQSDV